MVFHVFDKFFKHRSLKLKILKKLFAVVSFDTCIAQHPDGKNRNNKKIYIFYSSKMTFILKKINAIDT